MDYRSLGRTGLKVSVLGYGAGAVGGLMVRGGPEEQERAVARALEAGITYFDTAPAYGGGLSERNLGRVLKALGAEVVLGTKYRLPRADSPLRPGGNLAASMAASLETSLARLGRDCIDLFQLHDPVSRTGQGGYTVRQMLEEAVPALHRLQAQGKCRFIGLTALGETEALREVLGAGAFDTAQMPYNLLNPSNLHPFPAGLPGQDFAGLMRHAAAHGVGVIGIRILAGGALSGEAERHPIAMPEVAPIASGASYAEDLANARRLLPLLPEVQAGSLAELAIRFAITPPEMGSALIGTASLDQLEAAIAAAEKGPLPAPVPGRIAASWGAGG